MAVMRNIIPSGKEINPAASAYALINSAATITPNNNMINEGPAFKK